MNESELIYIPKEKQELVIKFLQVLDKIQKESKQGKIEINVIDKKYYIDYFVKDKIGINGK